MASPGIFPQHIKSGVRISCISRTYLGGRPVDVRLVHLDGVVLQREHVVREDDDLVGALLVVADQELGGSEFVRVHCVQQLKMKINGCDSDEKTAN